MRLHLVIIMIGLMTLAGCSSAPIEVEGLQEGTGLPEELQEKFAVKDTGTQPPATSEPSALPTKTNAKKTEKPSKAAKVAIPEKFVFPSRRPAVDPLKVGEKIVLEVTYFGVAAGLATLQVQPHKVVAERKVYHISANAKSSKIFSMFYNLDDTIESFLDFEGLFSHRFHLVLNESKQTRDSVELYDSQKKETYYWDRWNHYKKGFQEKKETHPIESFPQDSLSALYYLRSLPLPNGAEYEYPVVSEGKSWRLNVKVVRRETLDTEPFGKVSTVVVKPETKFNGVVNQKGDSFIWLTDDDRKILVRLEAKVKIGTVAARIREYQAGSP